LLAEEKVQLIDPINRAIFWDLASADMRQCRLKVYNVNNFIVEQRPIRD